MSALSRAKSDPDAPDRWYRRSARVSASSAIYHLGLDLFCLGENLSRKGRARQVFAVLAARDLLCALWLATSDDVAATSRRVAPAVLTTDLVALRVLRPHLPAETVPYDRSLSQFGLAIGWATQFAHLPTRTTRVLGHVAPLLFQAAVARTFQLDRRTSVRYQLGEAVWSTAALVSVGELLTSVRSSVDRGQAAAQSNISLGQSRGKMLANQSDREGGSHAWFNIASADFKGRVESVENDENATAFRLANAEADRLRTFTEPDTYTAESLPLLIVALATGDGRRVPWHHRGPATVGANPLHTRTVDADRVRGTIQSVLDIAEVAEIRTETNLADGARAGTLTIGAVDRNGTLLVEDTFDVVAGSPRL
jgi:hypothetical protein